jgi:MoxR-like ATPase
MTSSTDISILQEKIKQQHSFVQSLYSEINKSIVGQQDMLQKLVIGLLANGHVLLEGLPGLAKTLAISSLSKAVGGVFHRIQFTPDLLPADIIGTMIYNPQKSEFQVKRGPIFANFILADEINRAPAKVQSALLQAMQEREVSIGDTTYSLSEPFLVLATQNPIEQEGTYPLPEAQMDRFMMKVKISYPTMEQEKLILRQESTAKQQTIQKVVNTETIVAARDLVKQIYLDEKIENYIVDIVFATRNPEQYKLAKFSPCISYGASPRASIALALASKAHAFLEGRAFVTPTDVRAIVHCVLSHRIGLTYEAEAQNLTTDKIVDEILQNIIVP